MIAVKHKGQKIFIPESAEDLAFSQYIAMLEWEKAKKSEIDLVCALVGIDLQTAHDMAWAWESISLANLTKELGELSTAKHSKSVTLSGQEIKVKPFELLTLGQRAFIEAELKKVEETWQAFPAIVAICLAPALYKDDWAEMLEDVKEEVLNMNVSEAVPLAFFLLRDMQIMKPLGRRLLTQKAKSGLMLAVRKWLSSVRLTRSTR